VSSSSPFLTALAITFFSALAFHPLSDYVFNNPVQFGIVDTREQLSKISQYLQSGRDSNVLFLGSSLVLRPAISCDSTPDWAKKPGIIPSKLQFIYHYDKADYFRRMLDNACHGDFTVYNLGVPDASVSDDCLLLDAAIKSGKHPKLVICGIAPRDFLASDQPDPDNTAIHEAVTHLNENERLSGSFTDQFFKFQRVLQRDLGLFRAIATSYRPPQIGHAPNRRGTRAKVGNDLADLGLYQKRYNPPNMRAFPLQVHSLEKLLQVAHAHNVTVILVSMPLTRENLSLLNPQALLEYKKSVDTVARSNHVVYVDLEQNSGYDRDDFWDSVHLNARGGGKFYRQLTAAIVSHPTLVSSLPTHKQLPTTY